MLPKPKCPVIAIEEHYWDAELASHFTGIEAGRPGETQRRLDDLGAMPGKRGARSLFRAG